MITTGNYQVIFYNRYGTKLKGLSIEQACYTEARNVGAETVRDSKEKEGRLKPASYTVDRRLYNSLDTNQHEASTP